MPLYSYSAINKKTGQIEKGEINAENVSEAHQKTREQSLSLISIREAGKGHGFNFKFNRVSLKDKIIFTRELGVMIKAGLSVVKALEALGKQTNNKYFQEVITGVARDIKGGAPMSKALEKYPKVFPDLYVSVVRAGEQSGQLSEVLFNLSEQQEKDADLVSKIKSAMVYPIIILAALVGVVFLIIFFVLPSLQTIFTESGMKLPIATRILLGASNFIRDYFYIFLAIVVGGYFAIRYWGRTETGRKFLDKLKISVPIFGSLTTKVYIARFTRTFAMLTKASMPILESLKIVKHTINNVHYQEAFERVSRLVEGGKTVSMALEKEKVFPAMVYQLVALGEESGNLEQSLLEVAKFYDKEVDTVSKNLSTMIEPVLLITMGIGVAFVVAAVLGPIYGLVQTF